jgi:Zn-dependent protease with chaperone function
MTTAALLALIAGVLAWPVPRLLAAASWPHRCPRAAIVLWQAIGLAGGVSALLAAVTVTVAPLSPDVLAAMADHARNVVGGDPLAGLAWTNLVGLAVVSALAARLFGVLVASTTVTLRERRRHRCLVDLAGCRHRAHQSGASHAECSLCDHDTRNRVPLRILDHPVAVAYCVPGVRTARVVVSRGLLNTLAPDELDAVLAHEQAHVCGRHDLVIQPFVAWERTFPFLRPAREATAAVSLLVEMLADDAAAGRTDSRTLARALARLGVARAPVPSGALGLLGSMATPLARRFGPANAMLGSVRSAPPAVDATRSPVVARIARLLDPPSAPWPLSAGVYLVAGAVFAMPPLVLFL